MKYLIGSEQRPLHIAIIGAGPAAFYAAGNLLKNNNYHVKVDIFDRLPTPYGLVRGGVAPDHQKIKNVTKIYERIAQLPHFHFWGNVTFGKDIHREELLHYFDSIIYAVGSQSDRQLGIPGESLTGSYSATEFVGWYNGHPDYVNRTFDLSAEKVAIIGMGNVAIDVARILAKTPEELAKTDIAQHALETLKGSKIQEIYLIARRGPLQAAFTPPEGRELLELEQTVAMVDPETLKFDDTSQEILKNAKSGVIKNIEILKRMSLNTGYEKPKKLKFLFQYSPVTLYEKNNRVSGIKLVKNKLLQVEGGQIKSEPTEQFEELPAGLVFRSVGYKGVALPGVPFDEKNGIIPNHNGQVIDPNTLAVCPGEYVIGWAKRGPSGVIGTNKPDAIETAQLLLADYKNRSVDIAEGLKQEPVEEWLKSKKVPFNTFQDWKLLDQAEIEAGMENGKPREKISTIEAMLEVIGHHSSEK